MNKSQRIIVVLAVVLFACCAGTFPQLFAAGLGIGSVVFVVALVLGGFLFLVDYWDIGPPLLILVVLLIGSIFWRPLLGVVIGAGAVGGLFLLVYLAISRGR